MSTHSPEHTVSEQVLPEELLDELAAELLDELAAELLDELAAELLDDPAPPEPPGPLDELDAPPRPPAPLVVEPDTTTNSMTGLCAHDAPAHARASEGCARAASIGGDGGGAERDHGLASFRVIRGARTERP